MAEHRGLAGDRILAGTVGNKGVDWWSLVVERFFCMIPLCKNRPEGFSESEFQELRSILTVSLGSEVAAVFFEDSDWAVAKTLLNPQENIDIKLTRTSNESSLNVRIQASDFRNSEPAPKDATVSRRVFAVSVAPMEFADISDSGTFKDNQVVLVMGGREYRVIG